MAGDQGPEVAVLCNQSAGQHGTLVALGDVQAQRPRAVDLRRYNAAVEKGAGAPLRQLHPDTVLQRIPEVSTRLQANDMVMVDTGDRTGIVLGAHTLAVLEAFSRPVSFSEALRRLEPRAAGAQDWIELTTTIVRLYEVGILKEDGGAGSPAVMSHFGFDNPEIQVKMLNDRARTQAYLSAIREVVRPGDVVLDLGTGTGVLAVASAQAGARHVYAIEAGAVGRAAQAVFEANGVGEQITLVEGWSTRVSLPERADVLVTETIGNEPLSEQVLELTLDARKRLLKDGARLVPGCVRVMVLPVTVPEEVLIDRTFSPAGARRWQAWYGIDFHSLSARNSLFCWVKPHLARGWPTFSEPLTLGDIDLREFQSFNTGGQAEFVATRSGALNGLLMYFELEMAPTVTFSLHPEKVDARSSWRSTVRILREPLEVSRGQRFSVSYKYPSRAEKRLGIISLG